MLQHLLKMQTTLTTVFIVLFNDRVRPTTSTSLYVKLVAMNSVNYTFRTVNKW